MNKITLAILALLLALTVSPALAAINVATVNYTGDCNSAYITISSGTVTVDLDDIKEFNISCQGYTAATLTISSTAVTISRDGNTTNSTWDITNANYNTVRELLTAMDSRSDITISEYDNITDDTLCTALNDVTGQDINGPTIYTVLATTQSTYTTTSYPTFGSLETALESTSNMTVGWSSFLTNQRKAELSTSTLDDQTKTSIKATPVTLTAGGTVDDAHSPYIKISGTIADTLFAMQLYRPTNWAVVYSDGTNLTIIGGP